MTRPFVGLALLLGAAATFAAPAGPASPPKASGSAAPANASGSGSVRVEWTLGLLDVVARGAPRAEVLREVARRTGSRITGLQYAEGEVDLDLKATPLGSALRTLAGNGGFALVELEPLRRGQPMRYELHLAGRGAPQPDGMDPTKEPAVWVEDLSTGRMTRQSPPPAPPKSAVPAGPLAPPAQPQGSVQVHAEKP